MLWVAEMPYNSPTINQARMEAISMEDFYAQMSNQKQH